MEAECEEHETLSSSDDEYTFKLEVPASKVSAPFVSLKVNSIVCKFFVDSGASVNIVSSSAVKVFGVDLQPCSTRVYTFNSSTLLPVIGKFSALIESKCSAVDAEFLVVESKTSLLGYTMATELGILQIANVSVEKNVLQQHPSLFTGLGKMKNAEVKLHIDGNLSPVHQTHQRIPFHQRKSLETCVESLLQQDMLLVQPGVSPCLSPRAKATWWCSFVRRYA